MDQGGAAVAEGGNEGASGREAVDHCDLHDVSSGALVGQAGASVASPSVVSSVS